MTRDVEQLRRKLQMRPTESRASLVDVGAASANDIDDEEAALLWLEEMGRDAPKPVDQVMREAREAFAWKSFRKSSSKR